MEAYGITEWENGVLVFTIKRENKRNAVNYAVMDGLQEAISLAKKPHIKALIVTGEGESAFCSGGDLSVFHELETEEQAYQMLSKMGNILYELLMLPKLTIALMNGIAVGGGCEIASACDIRVARKGIKAGFVQGKLAITTGWGGGTILLEKLAVANAMKMLLEARIFSSEELMDLGFIQYMYEGNALDGLRASIDDMLQLEGEVLAAYKEMLIRKWNETHLKERIDMEIRKCAILWESEAHHKQVARFVGNKN